MTASTVDDSAGVSAPAADVSPATCAWTAHPLRDEPAWKSAALGLVIAGVSALAAVSFGHPGYGAVSLLVLTGAMAGYLFPTRYRLDDAGASWRQLTWRRRPWSAFRRVDRHRDGLFLSPFGRPHRLDSFRGLFLRFGGEADRERIDGLVRRRLTPPTEGHVAG